LTAIVQASTGLSTRFSPVVWYGLAMIISSAAKEVVHEKIASARVDRATCVNIFFMFISVATEECVGNSPTAMGGSFSIPVAGKWVKNGGVKNGG
jgi:hypothetical protein